MKTRVTTVPRPVPRLQLYTPELVHVVHTAELVHPLREAMVGDSITPDLSLPFLSQKNRMPSPQAVRWVFTLNNYSDDDIAKLATLVPTVCSYLIYGKETCPTTLTPHLQGYLHFVKRQTLSGAKALLGNQSFHLEASKGTPEQAAEYCKKEGSFVEFGQPPKGGKRNDWHDIRDWMAALDCPPSDRDLLDKAPHLWARNRPALLKMAQLLCPPHRLVEGDPREWQERLSSLIDAEPNDRTIYFVVDPPGNNGKTWFQKWYLSKRPNDVQLLLMGKRDDMAYSVDDTKSVFMINVPRGSMEFLQYAILEMIKDRVVHSPKYESTTKFFKKKTHVIVFCNEYPVLTKMTQDRPVFIDREGHIYEYNGNYPTMDQNLPPP